MYNGFQKNWSVRGLVARRHQTTDQQLRLGQRIAPVRDGPRDRGAHAGERGQRTSRASRGARFTADGRGVYLITNRDSEFEQLRARRSRDRRGREPHRPHPLGHRRLRAQRRRPLPRLGGQRRRPQPPDRGQRRARAPKACRRCPTAASAASPSIAPARRLALSLESAQSPRDVFVLEARAQCAGALHEERGRARSIRCNTSPAELVRFPTFDRDRGKYRRDPRVHRAAAHAGPASGATSTSTAGPNRRHVPTFNPFTQFLVREMGFVVITPNVRGSTGYGKTFMNLDNGEDREDSVKDIGALLVWIGAAEGPGRQAGVRRRAARTAATCRSPRW